MKKTPFILILISIFIYALPVKAKILECHNFEYIYNDSLNRKLYDLITLSKLSQKELLVQVENLIKQGANPNAQIKTASIHRKNSFFRKRLSSALYSTPLHVAVKRNNIPLVKKMIDLGANLNIRFAGGYYPIVDPLEDNNTDMVMFLIQNGADISKVSPAYSTDAQLIKKIIELGANPNTPTGKNTYLIDQWLSKNDSSMVFFLIENGLNVSSINLSKSTDVALISKLIKKGANKNTINIKNVLQDKTKLKQLLILRGDMQNHEPLSHALIYRDKEILEIFLETRSYKIKNNFNECPLIFSVVEYNDLLTVKRILELGEKPDVKCTRDSLNLLILAAKQNNTQMLNFFLEKGLDPNSSLKKGLSVLQIAIDNKNEEMINMLIDAGSDTELRAGFVSKKTALEYAIFKKNIVAVKILINKGANVNTKNRGGRTPLFFASKSSEIDLVKLLIENGANINIKGKLGETPLIIAIESGKIDLVKLLIEKGADANFYIENMFSMPPLYTAIINKNLSIIKILIENGADTKIRYKNKIPLQFAISKHAPDEILEYLKIH